MLKGVLGLRPLDHLSRPIVLLCRVLLRLFEAHHLSIAPRRIECVAEILIANEMAVVVVLPSRILVAAI